MEPGGVQSVDVGMSLVRALLQAGGPISLSALSEAAKFAPPKAHRYLVSLARSGLVEREPGTGRYNLGPLAVELGLAALGRTDRDGLARAAVLNLSAATGMTGCLTVWTGESVIVTAVELGLGMIFTGVRMGAQLPLLRSASGRMFLAQLPRTQTDRLLAKELREAPDAPVDRASIDDLLKQIRQDGVSTVRDMVMTGMSGLAAPVFDHSNHIAYTVTLQGPSPIFDDRIEGPLVQAALTTARALSKKLGYTGHMAKD